MLIRMPAAGLMRLALFCWLAAPPACAIAAASGAASGAVGIAPDAIGLADMGIRPLPGGGAAAGGERSAGGASPLAHVANTAALAQLAPMAHGRIVRDGFATSGDGGRAEYVLTRRTCPLNAGAGDGGSQIGLRNGRSAYIGCALIDWASVGGEATPELFGGTVAYAGASNPPSATGLVNARPAIQAAFDTGMTVRLSGGLYLVSSCIKQTVPGQRIEGRGRDVTTVAVSPGYSYADGTSGFTTADGCSGIIVDSPSVYQNGRPQAPQYVGLRVKIFQPEVAPASDASRTDGQRLDTLLHVACIDSRGGYGGLIRDVTLGACWRGIDLRGDVGQWMIDNVEISSFLFDLDLDGAQDTMRVRGLHGFPVNMTANQAALAARTGISIHSGRMDDLDVSDSLCISSRICFHAYAGSARTASRDGYASPGGQTTGTFTNYDFDTVALGFQNDGGNIALTGGYFASTLGGVMNAGATTIAGPAAMTLGADGYFQVGGTAAFTLSGSSSVSDNNSDSTFIRMTGGTTTLTGITFGWNPGAAAHLTRSKVWVAGGTLVATGNNVFPFKGTYAAGNGFFRIDNDGAHVVRDNSMQDWRNVFPVALRGSYGPNAGAQEPLTLPTYAQVAGTFSCSAMQGRSWLISDGAHVAYGATASGHGSTATRVTCLGGTLRYQ